MLGQPRRIRAGAREASEDVGRNPSPNSTLGDVIAARFSRRDLVKGGLAVATIAAVLAPRALAAASPRSRFDFEEIAAGVDEFHHVASGHVADVLIRWGDPVVPGASSFDPSAQTAARQRLQFGYNNDFVGYLPMPGAAKPSKHGLLVVNHEYTNEELMFPGLGRQDIKEAAFADMTRDLVDIEIAAHGGSVIEVLFADGRWQVVQGSRHARRITADTPMHMAGPAAGHSRLATREDDTGRHVLGTVNNCAGGITPWGTWLTAEENFHGYFWGTVADDHPEARNYRRYGVAGNWYAWGRHYDRFDVVKEPNEANRFGWLVEIDPFDADWTPRKRTALGRFKHEGCHSIVNRDGRVVVYSGDDERFEYVYRFVTALPFDPARTAANRTLLDDGVLSVARFNADGTVDWLPLLHGTGPLTSENGFDSQADVVIETRRAADLLGATKMDRPEDVEPAPGGRVYVMLTGNTRTPDQTDAANPRPNNVFGHIIEMIVPAGDHTADTFRWEILVKCGDPTFADVGATFSSDTSRDGWFGMPDNCAIDSQGRLWVATDGNSAARTGRSDGLWAVETDGPGRGTARHFFRCPAGAELCGPEFTPDGQTLFLAVQHPGDDGERWPAFGRPSTFEDPSTRWPDFEAGMPPRPSIVVVTRRGGGRIG